MNARKALSRHACTFVLMAMAAFGGCLQGAPAPVDPIVGGWVWHGRELVTFKADGTVHHSHGSDGTWQYLHNPEVQRHYRIVWNHGTSIDEVACSEDGQRAHVRNDQGVQFNAHRTIDDQPAASSQTLPPSVPGPIHPASATPKQTPTTAASQPIVADTVDPIVGEWSWLKGQTATFLADGTVKSAVSKRGTWEFLHNPEVERKYRVTLGPGRYTSDVLYDPATGAGRATNTLGKFFGVAPKTATSDKPQSYFGVPGH